MLTKWVIRHGPFGVTRKGPVKRGYLETRQPGPYVDSFVTSEISIFPMKEKNLSSKERRGTVLRQSKAYVAYLRQNGWRVRSIITEVKYKEISQSQIERSLRRARRACWDAVQAKFSLVQFLTNMSSVCPYSKSELKKILSSEIRDPGGPGSLAYTCGYSNPDIIRLLRWVQGVFDTDSRSVL